MNCRVLLGVGVYLEILGYIGGEKVFFVVGFALVIMGIAAFCN